MKPASAAVDLQSTTTPDGTVVWRIIEPAGVVLPADVDHVRPAAFSTAVQGQPAAVVDDGLVTVEDTARSTLPRDRMADNGSWDRIVESIRAAEAGRDDADEIVVQPGGALVPVRKGEVGNQLSRLPRDRMAASRARPADLDEVRRLDPANVEQWRFVDDPHVPGLTFRMAPVARVFDFFCFRSAAAAGRWYLSVLSPRFDELVGHEAHVMQLNLGGGERIPIVCRDSTDSSHATLAEVRGTAAKFAVYHSLREHGHVPFSA